jgi:uncharacterized protein YegL
MKKNYTDIIIVLDRSGSMQSVRTDTIGGVNKFIEEQQKTPGEATFSLFLFDHEYNRTSNAIPIKDARLLTEESYQPRGNTCLYGAIGCAINETGERLKNTPEDQRPEKVIFVIVTDGEENSSHKHEWSKTHTAASIKSQIELQSGTYKWEFVYIGANQDAIQNAGRIGINADRSLNYTQNHAGTKDLYGSLSSNVRSMRLGSKADMSWETKDRQLQAQAAQK